GWALPSWSSEQIATNTPTIDFSLPAPAVPPVGVRIHQLCRCSCSSNSNDDGLYRMVIPEPLDPIERFVHRLRPPFSITDLVKYAIEKKI
ncbi:MAG: hypothetical protein ABWY25_04920, partial [Paenisporosarcina sp.]